MAAMQEENETDRKHMSGADVAIHFPQVFRKQFPRQGN